MRDYNIESDLKQEKFEVIKLVQGDKGNKLTINVLEDGKPVSLTGCSITAKYKRADGQVINGSVTNISNNSFDAVIDSDITKVSGTLKMLFSIEKDDVKVSTFLLLADVREGLLENTGSSGGSTGGGEVTVDLSNYYKKNETYSKAQIDSQFKDIVNEDLIIGTDGKLYLKQKDGTTKGAGVELPSTGEVTDEQVATALQSKIDDGTLTSIALGENSVKTNNIQNESITKEKTDFFNSVNLDSLVGKYKAITYLESNTNEYTKTDGYKINGINVQYNVTRPVETTDGSCTYFRKVKARQILILAGISATSYQIVNKDLYKELISGYKSQITTYGDNIPIGQGVTSLVKDTDFTQESKTSTEVNEALGNSGSWYYKFDTITIPNDGYLMIESDGVAEYVEETLTSLSLESTLKNDISIGKRMSQLLDSEDFIKKYPKQIDYNFKAMSDMIEKNSSVTPSAEFKSDSVFGDKMFCGGICVNNKIYFCPNTSAYVMVYDLINDCYYFVGDNLGDNPFKYTGMVQYNGFIYCICRGVNNLLQINPVTDEILKIELDTRYTVAQYNDYRDSHHYNGCINDEGYLYLPFAYASNKLLKINMNTFTHEELDFTCEHSTTWQGCCNLPNDKILFIGNKGVRVWDCVTDTVITDVNYGGNMGLYDMVLDPRDGCLYGYGYSNLFKFNPKDNTLNSLVTINYLQGTYGTVLGIDGKFYTIKPTGAVIYEDKDNLKVNADTITTCNIDGMTVCSAGLVLCNDGSIFSVPGNGRLIKIGFTGVTGRLPDYITASKYYGKY